MEWQPAASRKGATARGWGEEEGVDDGMDSSVHRILSAPGMGTSMPASDRAAFAMAERGGRFWRVYWGK